MLATRCPMCGRKFNTVKVVSWPRIEEMECYIEDGIPVNSFSLIGVDAKGDACCSYDYQYSTREEADKAAASFTEDDMSALAADSESNMLACSDEHGYFMDYGPVDSDPYD